MKPDGDALGDGAPQHPRNNRTGREREGDMQVNARSIVAPWQLGDVSVRNGKTNSVRIKRVLYCIGKNGQDW